jgi:hypothetical protein
MLFIWVKAAEIASCVLSTGYAQVFELYRITACVIHTIIHDCVKLFAKAFSHLSLPQPVPLNMIEGALNTRIIG